MGRGKDAEVAAAKALSTVDNMAAASLSSLSRAQKRAVSRRSRLPDPVRFALVVVLSFSLSSLVHALLGTDGGQLATIARMSSSKYEIGMLAAWRIFELALGWFGDYDGYDLASLALLSHGPTAYLLSVFYGISPLTTGVYLGVEVVSCFLPFLLLRQLSGAHSAAPGVPNREIVVDRGIQVLTSLLSALIYNVVLFLACRTFLPTILVLNFEGIPTIEPATDAMLLGFGSPTTQVLSLLFGIAARTLIFTPLVTTPEAVQDKQSTEFDPVKATLGQTVAWNLWGYTNQTKVSILRTTAATIITAVGTYLQCTLAINGVDSPGAATYAAVWAVATMATGLGLEQVGGGI
ncbi:hypothetical protein B0H66DRAFT_474740 [Apodospora peruviana]|uniref:Uncharacterized protein n=1 Tax=Apodospora peruviana TaxID=516989 RepID=A0AAE0ICJ3_9PEZI|nr:hypothetical protein B0H66DRAFT_474740 [Apodospora peruviana]